MDNGDMKTKAVKRKATVDLAADEDTVVHAKVREVEIRAPLKRAKRSPKKFVDVAAYLACKLASPFERYVPHDATPADIRDILVGTREFVREKKTAPEEMPCAAPEEMPCAAPEEMPPLERLDMNS